jgi:putative oxidoreductase
MKKYVLPVIMWLFTANLAFVFIRSGWVKFDDTGGWARAFANWGYPVWFRIFIGVVEVVAGLLILYPKTAIYAVAALVIVMLGGMGTHIYHGDPGGVSHEAVPLTLLLIVGYLRYQRHYKKGTPEGEKVNTA